MGKDAVEKHISKLRRRDDLKGVKVDTLLNSEIQFIETCTEFDVVEMAEEPGYVISKSE